MQVINNQQEAQVSGVKAAKFGFEMNAKMYDILISKMYTNKQGAVIRELSANAWDAHVEAGKHTTPFDIHLPTWLDKTFSLRDYGTGIPHDLFEQIYTNVGVSTKEGSNDLIGGFGLGSKTPFTMTDQFMVENWYRGTKSTWMCFKDKGEPQVTQVNMEDSDEPSGLKVSFSFDEGDVPEFTKQVVQQLRFFPLKPNVTGGEGRIEWPVYTKGWENLDYFYSSDNTRGLRAYSSSSLTVIMGNVGYTVNTNEFNSFPYALFKDGLVLKVPIGSVDIPPSRESIELTSRTRKSITGLLSGIMKSYRTERVAMMAKCKTLFDLRITCAESNYDLMKNTQGKFDPIVFDGVTYNFSTLRLDHVNVVGGYTTQGIQGRYKQVLRNTPIHLRNFKRKEYNFYVNDLGTGHVKHINNTWRNHNTGGLLIFKVVFTPKDKASAIIEAQDTIEKETGVRPKLLSSLFGSPPKVTRVAGAPKSKTPQFYDIGDVDSSTGSTVKFLTPRTDAPKDGYYVELQRNTLVYKEGTHTLKFLLSVGLTEFLDKPIYAVRTNSIGKLDSSMTLLTEAIVLKTLPKVTSALDKYYKRATLLNTLYKIGIEDANVLELAKELPSNKLRVYMRYYRLVKRTGQNTFDTSPERLYKALSDTHYKTPDFKGLPPKVLALQKEVEDTLELLNHLLKGYRWDPIEKRKEAFLTILKQATGE